MVRRKMLKYVSFFSVLSLVLLYGIPAQASASGHWVDWLVWIGWGGIFVFILLILGKIIELTIKQVILIFKNRFSSTDIDTNPSFNPQNIQQPGRRRFLQHFIDMGIIAGSGYFVVQGLKEGLRFPQVKDVQIQIENLHPDLRGFRIVQLTDLHLLSTTDRNWVQDIVTQVNSLNADIIALTGDIVDGNYAQLQSIVAPLADLNAKFGNFFVSGNHEYMVGIEGWIPKIQNLGFSVLQNENHLVSQGNGKILLGGVEDYSAPLHSINDSSPAKAILNKSSSDVKIILAHQPRSIYEAARAGFDLQLSGHTHGGLFRSTRWLASLAQPFQSGLYKYKNTQIYVSNGTGYWGVPLRINTPSEITLLTLTAT